MLFRSLLRAYEDAGSFLETPVGGLRATPESSLSFLLPSDKEGVLGTIGPYEVLDEIGRGGMGVVMRAVDPKLNRVVAVKALLPELAANPNSRRRFLREAQAAAAISHPHVVAIYAVDDAHQDVAGKPVPPYLVMECVIGQSLQQKLDRVGPLRLAEILRISCKSEKDWRPRTSKGSSIATSSRPTSCSRTASNGSKSLTLGWLV